MFTSRVDDKGRLKLPVDLQRYLTDIGATQIFITSFEGRIARIYPIPVWEEAERLLESPGDDAAAGEDLLFKAQMYGGDAEIDAQGRVLMPATLRREMGVENQPVFLATFRGHIAVFSQSEHDAKKHRADEKSEDKLQRFVSRGLR